MTEKKPRKKYSMIPIDLPLSLWKVLDDITALSGLTRNQMLRAILALELYKLGANLSSADDASASPAQAPEQGSEAFASSADDALASPEPESPPSQP